MSPSRSTCLPHLSHCCISGVIGIGGRAPEARACVAAGPHGLPTQPGGINRSVGSLPSCPLKSSVMPQTKVHMNLILE